jgi:hypothetical protein
MARGIHEIGVVDLRHSTKIKTKNASCFQLNLVPYHLPIAND